MTILHICAGWQRWNGAANIARFIMGEQEREGHAVSFRTWASIRQLRSADEVWIHCGWLPCLWWATLWGRNVYWMPECCYDPVRLAFHGWKKRFVGLIERFCLRRCAKIVATCEAEKGWVEAYLGRNCPPVEVTDIKRFFNLPNPGVESVPTNRPLHLLYLGRKHLLKGLEYLEEAVKGIEDVELRIVSNAFGEEKEKVWEWCDVLVLPTLSDNFGLVIAEALERGKRVITTDGAPAWGDNLSRVEVERWREDSRVEGGEILFGYNGQLIYLKGYRDGSSEKRIELLRDAIKKLAPQGIQS